jgi:glutamate mutase epsilon subunit
MKNHSEEYGKTSETLPLEGLCQSLNILQDVAALWALKEVGIDYLRRFGYGDVFFSLATHQWM